MKIIQNIKKYFRVSCKKVGSVGFSETIFGLMELSIKLDTSLIQLSQDVVSYM